MKENIVLFNSLDDKHNSSEYADLFTIVLDTDPKVYDMTNDDDMAHFKTEYTPEADIIICGGDATLMLFVNRFYSPEHSGKIFYCSCDCASDFTKDIPVKPAMDDIVIDITDYLGNLPIACIDGKEYKFINGVGFGLDVDIYNSEPVYFRLIRRRKEHKKRLLKDAVFKYDPIDITVNVDGEVQSFEDVWLAPTLAGRYYCDGMMLAPDQDRLNESGTLSLVVLHGARKRRTVRIINSTYKEKDRSSCRKIDILTGKDISVEFSSPCSIQVDGNDLLPSGSYSAHSPT
jgi:hypothetical protein